MKQINHLKFCIIIHYSLIESVFFDHLSKFFHIKNNLYFFQNITLRHRYCFYYFFDETSSMTEYPIPRITAANNKAGIQYH